MKKSRFALLVLTLTAVSALAGCSNGKTNVKNDAETTAQAAEATTLATDSITYSYTSTDSTISSSVTIDYPTGTDSLSLAVRRIISDKLADQALSNIANETPKRPNYTGDINNGQAMADFFGKCNTEELKKQKKEDDSHDPDMRMSYDVKVKKELETAKYISLSITSEAYLGGAHGSATGFNTLISKQSRSEVKYTVDSTKLKELQPLLKEGVVSYFKEMGEADVTTSNIGDYLIIEGGTIPLPVNAPYFAADGVHFIYQQYEIAPYAAGMVGFVIPFDKIKPYLTPEAQKLLD